eukprot:TRINITY_DN2934_c1_g1_i1.p1 TRINITY_DN2934_c1_g1~~TRINITY_DN2934_c1_g1_i1.p1  ORF type:complete len:470 (+),score=157.39 TRINITY_DN2934_c1_g1_i1:1712-3121(+)
MNTSVTYHSHPNHPKKTFMSTRSVSGGRRNGDTRNVSGGRQRGGAKGKGRDGGGNTNASNERRVVGQSSKQSRNSTNNTQDGKRYNKTSDGDRKKQRKLSERRAGAAGKNSESTKFGSGRKVGSTNKPESTDDKQLQDSKRKSARNLTKSTHESSSDRRIILNKKSQASFTDSGRKLADKTTTLERQIVSQSTKLGDRKISGTRGIVPTIAKVTDKRVILKKNKSPAAMETEKSRKSVIDLKSVTSSSSNNNTNIRILNRNVSPLDKPSSVDDEKKTKPKTTPKRIVFAKTTPDSKQPDSKKRELVRAISSDDDYDAANASKKRKVQEMETLINELRGEKAVVSNKLVEKNKSLANMEIELQKATKDLAESKHALGKEVDRRKAAESKLQKEKDKRYSMEKEAKSYQERLKSSNQQLHDLRKDLEHERLRRADAERNLERAERREKAREYREQRNIIHTRSFVDHPPTH